MSKKIIIYNSFAHDGHSQLLRRQLVEVNKELLTCKAHDKKALINERRLLQRKLRGRDEIAKPTPAEEQAYAEGYHSQLRSSPYSETNLTAHWERGRKAAELKNKFRKNSYVGGVRGQRFDPPKVRQADAITKVVTSHQYKSNVESGKWVEVMAPSKAWFGASAQVKIDGQLVHLKIEGDVGSIVRDRSRDFRSERGYVAKIINTAKGSTLARSEPMISEASARKWAAEQAPKFRTMRTKAELEMVFYDPDRM
jgi:hypothetical protein